MNFTPVPLNAVTCRQESSSLQWKKSCGISVHLRFYRNKISVGYLLLLVVGSDQAKKALLQVLQARQFGAHVVGHLKAAALRLLGGLYLLEVHIARGVVGKRN